MKKTNIRSIERICHKTGRERIKSINWIFDPVGNPEELRNPAGVATPAWNCVTMTLFEDINSGYTFCMKMGNPCSDDILRNGIYEYPLIEWCQQYLRKTGTFIDVGAHMGTYSIILSPYCKKVHSFEAQDDTFDNLNEGIKANSIDNIVSHNIALGSNSGEMTLKHVSEDGGGSSLLTNISELTGTQILSEETVTVEKLDEYSLDDIMLIKIDVEGFELEVIEGSIETLKR